ncbi:MAG: nicotinate-nucleotide--dimethylbenzimidazole phosphoribosyltransferase [Filomicrobium sp.]
MLFSTPEAFATVLAELPSPNEELRAAAAARQEQLTKPPGSLGRLEDISTWLASWQPDGIPRAEIAKVIVFAGNHGVTAQGVSPYPPAVTAQMVANFQAGGAAINSISSTLGLELDVVALSLETPTADITTSPAMTVSETLEALNAGAAAVGDEIDVLVLGEMGIGNTTIAAALCATVFGDSGADWVGPGTGHDQAGVARKANIVDKALARAELNNPPGQHSAFKTLRQLGGREQAAIAGAILAARQKRVPVVIDGYVVTACLAPMFKENPAIIAHCIAGHVSAEPAHAKALRNMKLDPLLNLGMRLGEGTGAALAVAIVRAAAATHNDMATFGQASVENRPDAQ